MANFFKEDHTMAKSAEELKALTLHEFNNAAKQFDNKNPSVYNMCRKDYPDLLAELEKEEFTDVAGRRLWNRSRDCIVGAKISPQTLHRH